MISKVTKQKGYRRKITEAKASGSLEAVLAAAKNNPTHKNRLERAIKRGFPRDYDFYKRVANGLIHLVAAIGTDLPMRMSEGIADYTSKMAETLSMALIMRDLKDLSNDIMKYSCRDGYSTNWMLHPRLLAELSSTTELTPPSMTLLNSKSDSLPMTWT